MHRDPTQFLGIPSFGPARADVLLLPLPIEKTVSYGTGTSRGPRAIIDASLELESFDEETLVEFREGPRIHTLPPVPSSGPIEECLTRIGDYIRPLRNKFVVSLGGEHLVTYGTVTGLFSDRTETGPGPSSKSPSPCFADDLSDVTVVQIDAHADLADQLQERRWSHGTVMRRLWERGCGLVQIGIRSLTRAEYVVATAGPRIETFYAHRLEEQWAEVLNRIRRLEGKVYLTIDVDGLDPSTIPSTGTPLPNGLTWRQTIELVRVLMTESPCDLVAADIVEFVPSAVLPGCDPTAARLAAKVLAWWWVGKRQRSS